MTPGLLVLDLDDTLYPERQFALSGFAAVDRWLEHNRQIPGFGTHAIASFNAGARGNVFDLVLSRMGIPVTDPLLAELVRVYRSHEPRITLHADAAWCLDHFHRRYDLGLLTDGYLDTQRAKVRALGIEHMFRAIVYSDEFGRDCWKPSLRPYQEMMARTGHAGTDCVYVSDNPAKDFVTANALGWTTIRIRRSDGIYATVEPAPGYEAALEIGSLLDLDAAIEACWSDRNPIDGFHWRGVTA